MPRIVNYDNHRFWQVTDQSAIRHEPPDRLLILNWKPGGEVMCRKSPAPVPRRLYEDVRSTLEGIV